MLVTDFKTVVSNPITMLYFNGGTTGVYLGVIAASLQLWRKRQSLQLEEQDMIACSWAIILTQSIYQMLAVLLNDNNTSSEVITLAVLSVVTLVILWKLMAVKQALLLYTISYLIVAFLQPFGIWQTAVAVSLILLCLGLIIQHKRINVGGKK